MTLKGRLLVAKAGAALRQAAKEKSDAASMEQRISTGSTTTSPVRGKTRARHARQQFFEKLRNSAPPMTLYLDEPDRLG